MTTAVPWVARPAEIRFPKRLLIGLAVFFVPMKAIAVQFAGQSIYVPYLALALGCIFLISPLTIRFSRYFTIPMTTVLAFSLLDYWLTGYRADVFIFTLKIFVLFALAALYTYLLEVDEELVLRCLFLGAAISVVYMVYQAISLVAFGASLPFTSVESLQIGRGLGARYGMIRTTGFTEEPSYAAVMMVGIALMLRSYELRSGQSQRRRYLVLLVGLFLCTSNSLLATIPLLLLFSLFYIFRVPFLFFALFYAVNLALAPRMLNLDETFFARFSSYAQFLRLPESQWWLGIGFNQYSTLPTPVFLNAAGTPTFAVDSIASLWGGMLLEGGLAFATAFCLYVDRVTCAARDLTGYALVAILIMLANYYSPWWPIVSLALAYAVYSRNSSAEAIS